jgi:DNA-directed RNA polymerase subunit RPC12/RpoP
MARDEIKPVHGVVICKKCGTNLPILDISRIKQDFSATCPRCGSRGFLARGDLLGRS